MPLLIDLPVLPELHSDPVPVHRHGLRLLLKAVEGRCFYCEREFRYNSRTTLDHVIPRSRGGTDRRDNLRLCCPRCNSHKADLTPAEWLKQLEHAVERVRSLAAGED